MKIFTALFALVGLISLASIVHIASAAEPVRNKFGIFIAARAKFEALVLPQLYP